MSTINLMPDRMIKRGIDPQRAFDIVIKHHHERDFFWCLLQKMFCVAQTRGLRLVFENPWNGNTYLKQSFRKPDLVDMNRMTRGDYFVKPTAYWFVNCKPTSGKTEQNDKEKHRVWKKSKAIAEDVQRRLGVVGFAKSSEKSGLCSEERSMISPDYARNFICDNILGLSQQIGQLQINFNI